MKKINTNEAPAAIGPYAQAIEANGFVFVSGQLPVNPATGGIESEDAAEQTRQSMNNIAAILKAAGADVTAIVKTTILTTDLSAFDEINRAYGEFFGATAPARACYQVAALPKGAKIEIEAIAAL